jgi:hypothetical protein
VLLGGALDIGWGVFVLHGYLADESLSSAKLYRLNPAGALIRAKLSAAVMVFRLFGACEQAHGRLALGDHKKNGADPARSAPFFG